MPQARRPRAKWHHVYPLLAAFNVFTIGLGLFLNHRLVETQRRTIQANLQWVAWIKQCDALSKQASQINAQGMNVLDAHDVPLVSGKMEAALARFNHSLSSLRGELARNVSPAGAAGLLNDCSSVQERADTLAKRTESMFSLVRDGRVDQAQSQLTPMNRQYDEVLRSLDELRSHLREHRQNYLENQIAATNAFQRDEWWLSLLIVFLVFAIVMYGLRLDRHLSGSESQMRETQERYRLLVEESADGILVADDDWNIQFANPAACQMFGYTPEEIVGLNVEDTYLPQDHDLAVHRRLQIRRGESVRYERYVRRKDGSRFLAEVVVRRLEQSGSQAIFRDITERKRAEEAPLRLAAIVESSHDAIVSTDLRGIITSWNAAAERLYGYTAHEIIGQSITQIIPSDRRPEKTDVLQRVSTGEHVGDFESCCVTRDGHRIPVSLTVSPIKDASGNIVGTSAIIHDITERNQAEERLRLQGTALEAAANAIFITDSQGIILWVNPAFTSLTGWSPEETIGKTPAFLKSGNHDGDFYRELWETIRAGRVWQGEMVNRRKDGSLYTEEMTITPVRDSAGNISRFVAIKQDITARKRAEESQRNLQRQQRALLDNIPDIAWLKDREGRYVAVNESLSQAYGHGPEEIIGKTDFDMVPAELAEAYRADDIRVMESGQRKRLEEQFEDAHGTRTWIDTIKSPIVNDQGEVVGTAGIARDITLRKKAEQALVASEERYRGLFETMREGFALGEIMCDAAGKPCDFRYLEVNHAFEEIVGIQRADVVGKTVREIFPQVENSWIDIYGKVALTGTAVRFENYLQALDKHLAVAAFSPQRGQFAAIFTDITQRKHTDETLRETNGRLENALAELKTAEQQVIQQERLRALGTMAGGVAHDFNNALAAILGFTELLLYRPELLDDKAKTRNYLEMMNTAAKDAGSVVNRLREFYRHRDRGEVFSAVDLNQLVQEVISLTQPKWKAQAEARSITIHTETELQDVPPVMGSAADLREVLTNLIFNAVDAMPHGGVITIRTHRRESRVILEVADTGTGMTEEVRQRCLEPFFSTKGDFGTGLGLSMVYGIIQRHEGTIDIQTQLNKGTTIILSLPEYQQTRAAVDDGEAAPVPMTSKRVLLVDDEPVVRHILQEYLVNDGHVVEVAANGQEGLDKFRQSRFDLVILDRAMPDMSGDQVGAAIKHSSPNLPVIMLTGFGSMMEAVNEKPVGIDFVISKPVTIDSLRQAIARAVGTN
jgi:PAS domain S-box-containing protein